MKRGILAVSVLAMLLRRAGGLGSLRGVAGCRSFHRAWPGPFVAPGALCLARRGDDRAAGGKHRKKGDLPSKTCVVCGRPFAWRKKWANVWDEVQYCSDRCRRDKKAAKAAAAGNSKGAADGGAGPEVALWGVAADAAPGGWGRAYALHRRDLVTLGLSLPLALTLAPGRAVAKALPPPRGEVEHALDGVAWEDAWPFGSGDFARLDASSDADFYATPRFVQHVDEAAVVAMRAYYARTLAACAKATGRAEGDLAVLDLGSSWTSHLPESLEAAARGGRGRVSGLGMNAAELQANPHLDDFVVKNLNAPATPGEKVLPYADASFDLVLCSLSVDYLTNPAAVFADAARVLRPGGRIHVVFGDRLFITKAVAVWTGKDAVDHVYTVGSYLHYASGSFSAPEVHVLRDGQDRKDPLYVVSSTRA